MDSKERQYIEENTARLDEWENTPLDPGSLYDDMSMRELKLLAGKQAQMIDDFRNMIAKLEEKIDCQSERIGQLTDALTTANKDNSELRGELFRMMRDREADRNLNESLRKVIAELESKLADAGNQAKVDRSERFGSKSQKGSGKKKKDTDNDTGSGNHDEDSRPSAEEEKADMGGHRRT